MIVHKFYSKALVTFGLIVFFCRPGLADSVCGIENCHGLDIQCGPKIAEICTEMYAFGDRCRVYAHCGMDKGKCVLLDSEQFQLCNACVKACEEKHKDNVVDAFSCESKCGSDFN